MSASPLDEHSQLYTFHSPTEYPPVRVVSLVPSVTESLFDLQLGDRVVGITDYCIHPAEQIVALPRVGGTKNPDIDRILALKPDLVIMNREENRKKDADRLQEAGIPLWVTHPRTVLDAINLLWEMMSIFDEPVMVERVRWIERQMDWTAGAAKDSTPVRVFAPIWYDPWMTFNHDTYMHDLLRICGGENVFATRTRSADLDATLPPQEPPADADTRYPRVTLAEVAATQPEVVLLPSEPYAFTEAHVQELSGLDIPAAKTGRIHLIDGTLLTWHGTRTAYALSELPPLLLETKE